MGETILIIDVIFEKNLNYRVLTPNPIEELILADYSAKTEVLIKGFDPLILKFL